MILGLEVEMVRKGISKKQISNHTGIPERTLRNKMQGKTDWKLMECEKVREIFPGMSLEYLFSSAEHG